MTMSMSWLKNPAYSVTGIRAHCDSCTATPWPGRAEGTDDRGAVHNRCEGTECDVDDVTLAELKQ